MTPRRKKRDPLIGKTLLWIAIILLLYLFNQHWPVDQFTHAAFNWVKGLGAWAPVYFFLFYVVTSGIIMPSFVLKIFSGTLFGIWGGFVFISVAAAVSSLIKFLLARYYFRDDVAKKIKKSPKWKAVDEVVEEEGWKMLILLRNVPVLNSMFLNYICGITKMTMRDFVFASFIGRIPSTLLYAYLGYVIGYSATLNPQAATNQTLDRIILVVGVLATAGVCYYSYLIAQKALKEKMPQAKVVSQG